MKELVNITGKLKGAILDHSFHMNEIILHIEFGRNVMKKNRAKPEKETLTFCHQKFTQRLPVLFLIMHVLL